VAKLDPTSLTECNLHLVIFVLLVRNAPLLSPPSLPRHAYLLTFRYLSPHVLIQSNLIDHSLSLQENINQNRSEFHLCVSDIDWPIVFGTKFSF
jgi:hypothetical protein